MILVGSSTGRVPNPPPSWVVSDPTYPAEVGEAFSLDLDEAAVDPRGDTLTFTITGTLPSGITRTDNVLSGTFDTAQEVSVTVTAADSEGLERDATISWVITAEDTTAPAVPSGFDDPIVDVQTLSFTISPFTEADFSHIEVWGSDASDGTYTELSPTIQYETDFILISRAGLTHSTAYYHKLKSVDTNGNTSAFSEVYSLTTSAPPQPTWEADASLNWTAGTPTSEVSTLTDAGSDVAADCFLESDDDITGLTISDPGGPGTRDVTLSYDGTGSTAARTIVVKIVADDDPVAPPDGGTGNPDYEFLFPQPFAYDTGQQSDWDGILNHSGNQLLSESNLFVTQAGVSAWKCQLTRGTVSGQRYRHERSVSPNSTSGFRLKFGYTYWFGMGIYFPSDGGWGTAKRTVGNSTTNIFQFHDVEDKDSSGKVIDVAGRPNCLFYMSDDSIIRDDGGRVEFAATWAGDPAKVSVAGSPTYKRTRVPNMVADMRPHFDAWKSLIIAYTPNYDINAAVPPRMRVWFNNAPVADIVEINAFNDDVQGYAKFGNYNPPWKASGFESTWTALDQMIHYYSRFRIKVIAGSDTAATGYADVDPGF